MQKISFVLGSCWGGGGGLQPVFHIWAKMYKKYVYFGLFGGPWGGVQWSDWAYLAFLISSHPYLCTCQVRKQSDKKCLRLNPKYEKNILYFGGPGRPLRRTQVNANFRPVRPPHRADICITRGKNNHQFFIYRYGPQYIKMCIFGYLGGPGWPIDNWTGPILLPSYPLTYINLHIKYGNNPIKVFNVIA